MITLNINIASTTLNCIILMNFFTKHNTLVFLVQATVSTLLYIQNCYGFENFEQEKVKIAKNILIIFVGLFAYSVMSNHLDLINKKLIVSGN